MLDDYLSLLDSQKGCCAICRTKHPGVQNEVTNIVHDDKKIPIWNVDHDHKTGKVRGLLCRSCNTALGLVKDSESILQAMIAYLKK